MELHVFTGDDDSEIRRRRDELLAGAAPDAGVEHVDVALDGGSVLANAVGAVSLFGGKRVVAAENIETLSDGALEAITAAAGASDALVVARCTNAPSPKLRKALAAIGTVTTCRAPQGKGVAMRVDELTRAAGLRLGGDLRRMLVERAGHDLSRVESVCRQLVTLEVTTPTRAQLDVLLGSSAAPGVPWTLTDALEAGDLAGALDAADGLEPIPVVAYLSSRAMQIGRLVDAGVTSVDDAATLLGLKHRFQAERLVRLARQLGPSGVNAAWCALAGADRAVKHASGNSTVSSAVVLDQLLVRLAGIYAPARART